MLDISVKDSGNGKLIFDWGADGSPKFDESGAHAVLSTFYARKGSYHWDTDGAFGTTAYKVVQDRFATGSQLTAAGDDALIQCESEDICTHIGTTAERTRTGAWKVKLAWRTPLGDDASRTVRL